MKKLLTLCITFVFLLLLWGCSKGESPQETYWPYGHACEQRNQAMSTYHLVDIEDNNFIQSSEGSLVTGYYENKELRIIKIAIYQSRHKVILRFYPFDDAIVVVGEAIRYATDKPLLEITEDDFRLDAILQAVIKKGHTYFYVDEFRPMYTSDETNYAEIYAKALEALGNAA